jgi:lipid A 3-O-deacylase
LRILLAAAALLWCAHSAPAAARVEELRLGIVYHNIRIEEEGLAKPKEHGPNVEGEIVFSSPRALAPIGAPRPYVMTSVNMHGDTSFAGAGLYWRWEFTEGWAIEPGVGYVIHDGERDIPLDLPPDSPDSDAFEARHQLLGSRDLFRSSLALEREVGPRLAWQVYYEHLSHGHVLDNGRNQGLDEAGIRLVYRLGA